MTRFLNDQAKVVFLWESGTYGVVSGNGVWPGLIQSIEPMENPNVIQTRFLGQANRNIGRFDDGPLDVEGTLTLQPQDWRFIALALGSVAVATVAGNSQNTISQNQGGQRFSPWTSGYFNPWPSFQLEESRTGNVANKNSIRTFKGCNVKGFNLNISQGEPVSMELNFVAQVGSWFSGGTTSVTAGSNRPYLWSDAVFQIDGATEEAVKNAVLSYDNSMEAPHYINGSRVIQVPYPLSAETNLEITQDLDANIVGSLYNVYFQGGSLFNSSLDLNYSSTTIGSHRITFAFSGCRITEMEVPVSVGGISELTYTVVPGSVSAVAHDRYSYAFF